MNISQRLRTCARHTGLDAVIELLNEAADEIDAMQARANGQATQPADVTGLLEAFDDAVSQELLRVSHVEYDSHEICKHFASKVRAIIALRPERVPMTDEQADALATEAFGEYMCDLNDDIEIALVRKVEAYHGITAQAKKEDE